MEAAVFHRGFSLVSLSFSKCTLIMPWCTRSSHHVSPCFSPPKSCPAAPALIMPCCIHAGPTVLRLPSTPLCSTVFCSAEQSRGAPSTFSAAVQRRFPLCRAIPLCCAYLKRHCMAPFPALSSNLSLVCCTQLCCHCVLFMLHLGLSLYLAMQSSDP